MTETALRVQHLSSGYGGQSVALHDLTLDVRRGQITTIVGPNGAGKSTLMKVLAGIHPHSSGRIELFGESIERSDARRRLMGGLSLCPERRRIFPEMTIEENLLMGALTARTVDARSRIEQAYQNVPWLKQRRKALAGNLSGGQQQILAIWRSMMSAPRLLLLDEPSLGLSPRVVNEVAQLIRDISNDRDITVLIVEQNIALGLRLATDVHVLNQGQIIRSGSADALRQDRELIATYLG
ncbi:ABC transporter ATP-binding protein [Mycobacterium sp. 21AC1]|uniref:ABC transporter ATP-binding protein n=1 Tax=[Mycobacterium] appelbergii TaxID=2939269 RepID=UPI0029393AB7|nr:ABC transporter ATP-binding protein [Mycobacterium sp. 21AC1]MDV3126986.1 ABC transporter ATP-binding protein [Mycobacterium sp. 21AC1]